MFSVGQQFTFCADRAVLNSIACMNKLALYRKRDQGSANTVRAGGLSKYQIRGERYVLHMMVASLARNGSCTLWEA